MNKFYPEIKKNFGFGAMRLPKNGETVDLEKFSAMVDKFMEAGFNYFDTAHVYIGGQSETALKACLTSRYPREAYILTNKLSNGNFETEEEIRPLFASQLEACGVEYFDFYLMHALNAERFEKYKKTNAFKTAFELKAEGKVRHVGLSFHDQPEVLDRILTEFPEVEAVQLQFNYLDYEDPGVASRACYEVCVKHGKPVIVMEPVKGGRLAMLHPDAKAVLDALGGGTPASYAVRYAAGFDNVMMVLSGMSTLEQVEDNVSFMKDFKPLDEKEQAAVAKVVEVIHEKAYIECTACRYCVDGCPMSIPIPDIFACMNTQLSFPEVDSKKAYGRITSGKGMASACIECGQCEDACPQHLPIRDLLKECKAALED